MDCVVCKNYQPTEPQTKPTGPRVTVLTFDRDGRQGSYSFRGEPDWPRIEREMLADGYMAVIVKGWQPAWGNVPAEGMCLYSKELDIKGSLFTYLNFTVQAHHCSIPHLGHEIALIQQAISDWREKQAKLARPVTLSPEQAEAVKGALEREGLPVGPTSSRAIDSLVAPAKPADWTPKLGERVHWDGVYVCETGGAVQHPAGEHTLNRVPGSDGCTWKVPYSLDDGEYWTTLDHLSPLPAKPEPEKPGLTWKHYNNWTAEMKRQYAATRQA